MAYNTMYFFGLCFLLLLHTDACQKLQGYSLPPDRWPLWS